MRIIHRDTLTDSIGTAKAERLLSGTRNESRIVDRRTPVMIAA